MSHFTVGVITKKKPTEYDLEDIMARWDENLSVEPYVYMNYNEVIEQAKKLVDDVKKKEITYKGMLTLVKKIKKLLKDEEKNRLDICKLMAEEYYCQEMDEEGNIMTAYNPESKWDWWVVGGRWSGMLDGKDQAQLKEIPEPLLVDDYNIKELRSKFPKLYKLYRDLFTGRKEEFYKKEYFQEMYPTFKEYIKAKKDFTTFAVVDENGEWHEKGEMGWFGMSSETPEGANEWNRKWYERFVKEKKPNWWITIIDCHI